MSAVYLITFTNYKDQERHMVALTADQAVEMAEKVMARGGDVMLGYWIDIERYVLGDESMEPTLVRAWTWTGKAWEEAGDEQ